jgi:hypothetical protein
MRVCNEHDDAVIVYEERFCPLCELYEERFNSRKDIETLSDQKNELGEEIIRLNVTIEDLEQANLLLQAALDKFGGIDIDELNDGR